MQTDFKKKKKKEKRNNKKNYPLTYLAIFTNLKVMWKSVNMKLEHAD